MSVQHFGVPREAKRHAALDSAAAQEVGIRAAVAVRTRAKAPSPLRSAGALQKLAPSAATRMLRSMPEMTPPWPHAPTHQLSVRGTYFVTAGTYLKAHHFRGAERLRVLHRGLLTVARDFGWQLEAWAVFSNHYHFVAHSSPTEEEATSLGPMLGQLHERTAKWLNRLDAAPNRSVWHNFWETR